MCFVVQSLLTTPTADCPSLVISIITYALAGTPLTTFSVIVSTMVGYIRLNPTEGCLENFCERIKSCNGCPKIHAGADEGNDDPS